MGYKDLVASLKDISAQQLIEEAAEKNWNSNTFISKASQYGLIKNQNILEYGKLIKQRENQGRMNAVEQEVQAQTPREATTLTGPEAQPPIGQGMSMPPGEVRQSGEITQDMLPRMKPQLTLPAREGATDQRALMASMAGKQVGGQRVAPEEVEATTTYAGMPEAMRPIDEYREKKLKIDEVKNVSRDEMMNYRWATLLRRQLQDELNDKRTRKAAEEKNLEIRAGYVAEAESLGDEIADEKKKMAYAEKIAEENGEDFDPQPYRDRIKALMKQRATLNEIGETFKELAGQRTIPTGEAGGYRFGERGVPERTAPAKPAPKSGPVKSGPTGKESPIEYYRKLY